MSNQESNTIYINECPVCTCVKRTELENLLLVPENSTTKHYRLNVVKCYDCGHKYQALIWEEKKLKSFYSQDATYYRDDYINTPQASLTRFKTILDDLQHCLKPEWKHLDIGGLTGHFSHFMSSYLRESHCLDISNRLSSTVPNKIKIIQNTLFELASENNHIQYDFISLNHTLEHLTDLSRVKRSIDKLLRQDGYLFIEVPNQLGRNRSIVKYSIDHIHYFSTSSLCRFLEDKFSIKLLKCFKYNNAEKTDVGEIDVIRVLAQKAIGGDATSSKTKNTDIRKIITSIEQKIHNESDVYIWGTGYHTKLLFSLSKLLYERTAKLIDSDISRQGRVLYGKPVIHPSNLKKQNNAYIVVSSFDYRKEIEEAAKKLFSADKIINPYS